MTDEHRVEVVKARLAIGRPWSITLPWVQRDPDGFSTWPHWVDGVAVMGTYATRGEADDHARQHNQSHAWACTDCADREVGSALEASQDEPPPSQHDAI